jgi:hypothetical protein
MDLTVVAGVSPVSRSDELLLVLDARKRVLPSVPPRLEKLCLTILAERSKQELGTRGNIQWVIRVISGSWLFLLFQKLRGSDEHDVGECLREISQ